jgi:predicted component of type VI protein secretion system
MIRNSFRYAAATAVALVVTAGALTGCSSSQPVKSSEDSAVTPVAATVDATAARSRPNPYAYLP